MRHHHQHYEVHRALLPPSPHTYDVVVSPSHPTLHNCLLSPLSLSLCNHDRSVASNLIKVLTNILKNKSNLHTKINKIKKKKKTFQRTPYCFRLYNTNLYSTKKKAQIKQ